MPRLVALHYEISLIEAGRSLLADSMGACVRKRAEVIEKIEKLRDGRPPDQRPGAESFSLCRELREIGKKMRDISVEGEWLEMQVAGKKYALSMVQQQHVVVSI